MEKLIETRREKTTPKVGKEKMMTITRMKSPMSSRIILRVAELWMRMRNRIQRLTGF